MTSLFLVQFRIFCRLNSHCFVTFDKNQAVTFSQGKKTAVVATARALVRPPDSDAPVHRRHARRGGWRPRRKPHDFCTPRASTVRVSAVLARVGRAFAGSRWRVTASRLRVVGSRCHRPRLKLNHLAGQHHLEWYRPPPPPPPPLLRLALQVAPRRYFFGSQQLYSLSHADDRLGDGQERVQDI